MDNTARESHPGPILGTSPPAISPPYSVLRAWWVLVVQSVQRHWRVRQMGWVAVGLLSITVAGVVLQSHSRAGWGIENRRISRTRITHQQYADSLLYPNRYQRFAPPNPVDPPGVPPHAFETPTPLDPLRDGLTTLILSVPHAVLQSEQFRHAWAFMNFSRWVMLGAFIGFVLPLFTLAYASGAFGTERESRTLVWLMTRPMPRSAVYLAKFLGALPWCLLFSGGGFVALCLAGGEYGRKALVLYWEAALLGTLALAALFHLVGAVFRRPVVVGLVYVFFYEALVAALPGSLKLLSVTFYARSLMYNEAVAAGYPAEMLNLTQAVSSTTARAVLLAATVGLTALGMWLFSRSEYRDDV